MTKIGILGLQGCIDPHLAHFKSLGVEASSVRFKEDLADLAAIVLPGGESSTMLKLLHIHGLFNALKEFTSSKPTWGICAGSILLAQEAINPVQDSLKVANIKAERNSYGSQLDSFKTEVEIKGIDGSVQVDFIRAPRFSLLNPSLEVLSVHNNDPVMVRDQHVLCSAFHTELGQDSRVHEYFLQEFVWSDSTTFKLAV